MVLLVAWIYALPSFIASGNPLSSRAKVVAHARSCSSVCSRASLAEIWPVWRNIRSAPSCSLSLSNARCASNGSLVGARVSKRVCPFDCSGRETWLIPATLSRINKYPWWFASQSWSFWFMLARFCSAGATGMASCKHNALRSARSVALLAAFNQKIHR